MSTSRSPRERLEQALDWIEETGWPSVSEDTAIANQIYEKWIDETNAQWRATGHRDREKLSDALETAFRSIRDARASDCAYIMFMIELELRGLSDGIFRQGHDH